VTAQNRLFETIESVLRRVVPDAECLVGDLREEYGKRGSHPWLLMQIATALSIGVWRAMLVHRRDTVSGALMGLSLFWSLWVLSIVLVLKPVGFPHAVSWQWEHPLLLGIAGAIYAFCSGWIVGRVHRTHRTAAVCGFAASVVVVAAFELLVLRWLSPSVFFVTVVPRLPVLIFASFAAPIPILLGGFWKPAPPGSQNRRQVRAG
jgi:hypothetical protein